MNFSYYKYINILNQKLSKIKNKINVSFEFFPPKTKKMKKILINSINRLKKFQPKFISITDTQNINNKNYTYNIVKFLKKTTTLNIMPHLTCINSSKKKLIKTAKKYWKNGIKNIFALRGDNIKKKNKIHMYAIDLVKLLKKNKNFNISVAGYPEIHPESNNFQTDLINLKKKIDAGANQVITQFFFNVNNYLRFRDRCLAANIKLKIIPGIFPIINFTQLKRFSLSSKVYIPNWMNKLFNRLNNNPKLEKILGITIILDIIKILLKEGIKDLHFYTLNKFEITKIICYILGINKK